MVRRSLIFALLLEVAAWVVDAGEVHTLETVHHQICCLELPDYYYSLDKQYSEQQPLTIWTQILNGLFDTRTSHEDKYANCLHEFGVRYVDRGKPEEPVTTPERMADTWTVQYGNPKATTGGPEIKDAQCASITFLVPFISEPLKRTVDFFTPEFLDELTRRRPRIWVERAFADISMEDGGWKIIRYSSKLWASYSYEEVYEDSNGYKFATEDDLRRVVSRRVCRDVKWHATNCKAAFAFIEAVTGTRAPEEDELGLLTKDEIKNLLTAKKLKSINFGKQMKNLKKELKKIPQREFATTNPYVYDLMEPIKDVPQAALDKLRPSLSPPSPSRLKGEYYDLSFLTAREFENLRGEACPKKFWTFRTRRAFDSREIANTFPQLARRPRLDSKGRRKRSNSDSRKSDRELSSRQITDFLLVNSLLAVTETKYSDLISVGAMHKLQRLESPIFAVCGETIKWEPRESQSRSGADWLWRNYRFTLTGSRHSSFEYGKLSEVNTQGDMSDDSQCAILALVGVGREGFKDLTRQPFDMIFGILTRKQMNEQWSNDELRREASESKLSSISAASGVDPWLILPGKYSSSLTLGQMMDQAAESIEESGSPEWPDARPRSRSRRSGSRKSST